MGQSGQNTARFHISPWILEWVGKEDIAEKEKQHLFFPPKSASSLIIAKVTQGEHITAWQ